MNSSIRYLLALWPLCAYLTKLNVDRQWSGNYSHLSTSICLFSDHMHMPLKLQICLTSSRQRPCLNTHSDFCVCGRETCQHATHGVPSWRLTCIHAIVSRSPWGSRLGGLGQKALQTMNEFTLFADFCRFLPNPFIQDLFLWHTSQEFVKRPLISLRYGLFDRALVDNRTLRRSLPMV